MSRWSLDSNKLYFPVTFFIPSKCLWFSWDSNVLTTCFASALLFSLSTPGMGKLISSRRCKFFLILGLGHLLYMLNLELLPCWTNLNLCQNHKTLFEHIVQVPYLSLWVMLFEGNIWTRFWYICGPSGPLLVVMRLAEHGLLMGAGWKGSGELRSWQT